MTTTTTPATDHFSTDVRGLAECGPPQVVDLADGDTFDLRIAAVMKDIQGVPVRMLAYNGSIPGPTLRVRQGSEIAVRVHNDSDLATTVHWHGVCLDNAYDGVPFETQDPIAIGGEFTYRVQCPDAGLYWYHPHVREDYGLDMGLYGNLIVDPVDDAFWPRADRDVLITLDDILIEDGHVTPYSTSGPNFVAMGRFGNVMLTGGQTDLTVESRVGEVVRFYLTNTANTRIFNVGFDGARMKLVGGDSGRYEHEAFVDDVLLSPSERAIVDVHFEKAGTVELLHRSPIRAYLLGRVDVVAETDIATVEAMRRSSEFALLRTAPEMVAERSRLAAHRDRSPDKTLAFKSIMPAMTSGAATDEHGNAHDGHMHEGHTHHGPDRLEWEDEMLEMNRASTADNMSWKLVDVDADTSNHDIEWTFRVGDQVKIRLVNGLDQDHPMHHPFHVHGAGRFLVLARDGEVDSNLVWKDTVLVRSGETVDILLDVTNPGRWMAHCHIAEHNQAGMMFSFLVLPQA